MAERGYPMLRELTDGVLEHETAFLHRLMLSSPRS